MANEALTLFERRFEDWSIRHPKGWIATGDKVAAANFISKHLNKIRDTQVETANRIILSQERIASGIDKVALGVERVADGIEGLGSAFEWGFSEMIWELEQQRTVLEEILKVLQAPLDTQAKELRTRAQEAYANGWIGDALEDFLKSEEKNRYDFTIHQSLGNIYLFHKKNAERAVEYYEKAVKYATAKSAYHASLALLHIGLARYLQGDFTEAYEATLKAVELSPELCEAHYQCAQYCANLGKYDEAIEHVRKAIDRDRDYCLKVQSEKDFDVMKEKLEAFFEDLRNKAQNEAKKEIDKAQELILEAELSSLSIDGKFSEPCIRLRAIKKKESAVRSLIERGSLFDCWDAIEEARVVQKVALDSLDNYFSDQISRANKEYDEEKEKLAKKATFCGLLPFWIVGIAFALLVIAAVVVGFLEGGIGGGILRGIFTLTIGVLGATISTFVIGGILSLFTLCIANHIRDYVIKKRKAYYESKLAKLEQDFAEVRTKQLQLGIEKTAKDMEDGDLYKDFLWGLYVELPKDLQEAGYSKEVANKIHEICTKNGVTDEHAIFGSSG